MTSVKQPPFTLTKEHRFGNWIFTHFGNWTSEDIAVKIDWCKRFDVYIFQCVEVDKEFRELQKEFKAIKEVKIKHGVVIGDYEIKIKGKLRCLYFCNRIGPVD